MFRMSLRQQCVGVFLCALFGLGIVGLAERRVANEGFGSFYRGVFLQMDQPHNGQDRGDESDTISVNAPSLYVTNTAAAMLTYRAGIVDADCRPLRP
jgi:hypothetical protein